MRVLQFAPRVCWPLDTGAKLRNYHLARVVSRYAPITLLAFTEAQESTLNVENPYHQIVKVKRDPSYTPVKLLRGALGRTPISLLNYTTEAMKTALLRLLKEQKFDVIQLESIHLMGYLPIIQSNAPRTPVVCDWHNIESELMQRYSERAPSFLRGSYARRTARQLHNLEKQATLDFDYHVVVSDRDRDQLLQLNSSTRVAVIENGVDSAHYSDAELDQAQRPDRKERLVEQPTETSTPSRLIFVGSMDYHANIHAVVDFAKNVWPAMHQRYPQLSFTIVGRDPAEEVQQLGSITGIEVTGTVEDVRPYYREALASLVPLTIGGGSRLKILESMAAGVPVVSTTLGAEGLEVENDKDIIIADTAERFVEAIGELVTNDATRPRLAAAGRELVARRYEWTIAGESLFRIYEKLVSGQEQSAGQGQRRGSRQEQSAGGMQ